MSAEELILRPLEDTDVESLQELLNDSYNQQLVGGVVAPMSRNQVVEWLQEKRNSENVCQFAIEESGSWCGYVQLVSIDKLSGNAVLGINILRRFQGKGLGKIAIQRVHDFARDSLLLRKLVLYVRSDNYSAVNLYLKIGYQPVGVLAQHVRTAVGYVDLKIMEIML
ncbi:GNAT family N-acetyltransferase [Pseudomonas stutzeri]|uniref:GNAT family N-acetyltransferase n=1 Tax=Stutzerimonas stutzeri TaxID=316 RepID=UPI00190B90CC|nr:GNAT family protein [Stutzerimonas stutzeri]MBK3866155.1 GNAT family N-acetyltransferase [Stutzerimonas stutzeri]